MKKGKVILGVVALLAVVGGAFAFKTARTNSTLYYLTTTVNQATTCVSVQFRTTTIPQETLGTVAPPASGIGWYTTSLCDIPETFKAKVTTD